MFQLFSLLGLLFGWFYLNVCLGFLLGHSKAFLESSRESDSSFITLALPIMTLTFVSFPWNSFNCLFPEKLFRTCILGLKKFTIFFLLCEDYPHQLFDDRGIHHIGTSPLICSVSQWTGFYMIQTLVMREINTSIVHKMSSLFLKVKLTSA